MSLRTSFWLLPQNEHFKLPLPSRVRAILPSLLLDLRRERRLLADRPSRRLGGNHFVNDFIFFGLLGRHEKVPIGVALDLLHALSGVMHEDAVELLAHAQNLPGLDVDVGGLPLHAAQR